MLNGRGGWPFYIARLLYLIPHTFCMHRGYSSGVIHLFYFVSPVLFIWCCLPVVSCNMTLSPWTLDNRRLRLDIDGPENFAFSIFSESNEWTLVNSSASKHVELYECGHTKPLEFTQLIYSLTIRRRVGFYVYALIIPSVLLSFMMPLAFWIPPSGDGRITLGILLRFLVTLFLYHFIC